MVFNSLAFIVFFAVLYGLYRLSGHRLQNRLLLVGSYFFYGWWDWRFLSLILISTLVDYGMSWGIVRSNTPNTRKLCLLISVCVNLGILFFFKYFNFFADSLQELTALFGWNIDPLTLKVILPIGISFYTFQTMGFTIDVYRGKVKPVRNFADFALYVAFFPQLVAGPIERASNLLPQIQKNRRVTDDDIRDGLWLIALGYVKKVVMADNLARIVDPVFSSQYPYTSSMVLLAAFAFAFQIYGDFSGYSNIARGIARLMGFRLMVNFRFPYFVSNPGAFWRHWHISLSSWLRDYLYIPLGGNRRGQWNTYRNLMLTMLLGGLWHGAAWTFIAWGGYHGVLLIAHRLTKSRLKSFRESVSHGWFFDASAVFIMFGFTLIGWLLFRAQSMTQFAEMMTAMAFSMDMPSYEWFCKAVAVVLYTAPVLIVQVLQRARGMENIICRMSKWRVALVYLAIFYLLTVWGDYNQKEFIYFQF